MERLGDYGRHFLRLGDLIAPFGNRKSDVDHVRFLKEIGAEILPAHLGGNADQRSGIQHRIGNACHEIGRPRTCGGHADTRLAGTSGITLCRMDSALLVTDKDMPYPVGIVVQIIVQRHDGTSGIPENGIHPFFQQRKQQCLGTFHIFPFCHNCLSYLFSFTLSRLPFRRHPRLSPQILPSVQNDMLQNPHCAFVG